MVGILEVEPKTSRALLIFEKAIHTNATKITYRWFLDQYLKYIGRTAYDELLLDSPEIIQKNLEDYIIKLGEKNSRSFVKMTYYSLTLFFGMNNIKLNTWKIQKLIPRQTVNLGKNPYSNSDVKKILEAVSKTKRRSRHKARTKALVHFLAASGCRLGAIHYLKIKDLTPIKNCYAISVYDGTTSRYTTFLTPEASRALNEYLEPIRENWKDYEVKTSFGTTKIITLPDFPVFNMTVESARRALSRLVRRSGVTNKTEHGRYLIPIAHGFRKRFNTILKSNNTLNPNLVEKLMGHSTTIMLDNNYLEPSVERLFEEYQKGIEDLTIYKIKPTQSITLPQNTDVCAASNIDNSNPESPLTDID